MEIRSDNWETLFDDEDDSEMVEKDMAMTITQTLCLVWNANAGKIVYWHFYFADLSV